MIIAVIGACVAAATTAPIPTREKAPGEEMEEGDQLWKIDPIKFPVIAPRKREGAKIPPELALEEENHFFKDDRCKTGDKANKHR